MLRRILLALSAFALVCSLLPSASAQQGEARIALVIGNAAYQAGPLHTAANDAGLIAQTLQAAGFDVVGARDLDQDSLRRAFRDFLQKAQASGPNTVAFIYLAGYGVQLEGDNYFVPIDARIARDTDVPAEALRLSDYTRPLAALRLKASIVVLDAARQHPFSSSGPGLASGLALVEAEPGMLIAFNAMPGTVTMDAPGDYGEYAQALSEMLREGGLPLPEMFNRVKLRVNEMTRGAEIPWSTSKVEAPVVFFERAADAPPPAVAPEQIMAMRTRPIRDFDAQEAYLAALERDTLQGYQDFLLAFPTDPMAPRVRAIIASRREAITWRRTRMLDTAPAYWSYLRRYPMGPHAADARRRLAFMSVAIEPPAQFAMVEYEVAPPPQDEIIYMERPVLAFGDPSFGFAPPPPPPVYFLPRRSPDYLIAAPIAAAAMFMLPTLAYRPVPAYVRPPTYVRPPPPNNVIYNNVHNTVVINNTSNTVTITNPSGQSNTLSAAAAVQQSAAQQGARQQQSGAPGTRPQPVAPGAPGAAVPAVATLGPALPPSVQQKANTLQQQGTPAPGTPGAPGAPRPLPGQIAPAPGGAPPSAALPPPAQRPGAPGTMPAPGTQPPGTPPPGVAGRPPGAAPGTQPPAGASPATPGAPQPGVAGRPPVTAPAPGSPPQSGAAPSAPGTQPPPTAMRPQPGTPGVAGRPPTTAPAPGTPTSPTAAAPPASGTQPPPTGVRPPQPGTTPPNVATRPPPGAPPATSPQSGPRPTPGQPPSSVTRQPPPGTVRQPPLGGPPPGVASRPPPQSPPPTANRPPPSAPPQARPPAPPPQVVNRPPPPAAAPPPRPAAPPPPPPPRVAAPPPPPPPKPAAPAPAPAAKPAACPPGKTMQGGQCK